MEEEEKQEEQDTEKEDERITGKVVILGVFLGVLLALGVVYLYTGGQRIVVNKTPVEKEVELESPEVESPELESPEVESPELESPELEIVEGTVEKDAEIPDEEQVIGNVEVVEDGTKGSIPIWGGNKIEELFVPEGKPLVVYFTMENCPHCVKQEEILEGYQGLGFEIRKVDKAGHKEIVDAVGVEGYPTMMFVGSDGEFPEIQGREYKVPRVGEVKGLLGYRTLQEMSEIMDVLD